MKFALPVAVVFRFRSLPVRGAWIEITPPESRDLRPRSLPVRGAWIEITMFLHKLVAELVAPRKGSVD